MESPPIFRIPFETRLLIYEFVHQPPFISVKGFSGFILLMICRQIYKEALPFCLGLAHLHIGSFDRLIKLTSGPYEHVAPYLGSAKFRFPAVNQLRQKETTSSLRPLVFSGPKSWSQIYQQLQDGQSGIHPTGSTSSAQLSSPNYILAEDVWIAISSLSSLTYLEIAMDGKDGSDCSAEFQLIIAMISRSAPPLRKLRLAWSAPLTSLTFLENFGLLKHFDFCGYSTSTAEETTKIFRCLPCLRSLTIDATEETYDGIPCNSHHVIRQISHLKCLKIKQKGRKPFISVPMLNALLAHKDSLEILMLTWYCLKDPNNTEILLDDAAIKKLFAFVCALPRLKGLLLNLYIQDVDANLDIHSLLPPSIVWWDVQLCDHHKHLMSKDPETESFSSRKNRIHSERFLGFY